MKKFLKKNALVLLCLIVVATSFAVSRKVMFPIVNGSSMEPNYHNGDLLILKKDECKDTIDVNRYDVVVIRQEYNYIIKRVIGLPGETIQIQGGKIYINGEFLEEYYGKEKIEDPGLASNPVTLGEKEFFVLGDNRNDSSDSRVFGAFDFEQIVGKISGRLIVFR